MALDGFSDADFDALWRYFEQTCGVCAVVSCIGIGGATGCWGARFGALGVSTVLGSEDLRGQGVCTWLLVGRAMNHEIEDSLPYVDASAMRICDDWRVGGLLDVQVLEETPTCCSPLRGQLAARSIPIPITHSWAQIPKSWKLDLTIM